MISHDPDQARTVAHAVIRECHGDLEMCANRLNISGSYFKKAMKQLGLIDDFHKVRDFYRTRFKLT